MELVLVTAALSICCLFATAAPQAQLPWQKLSAASQSVYRNTDDILRFEPMASIENVWESFKARHGMTMTLVLILMISSSVHMLMVT